MGSTCVVGLQWGDEAKGKVVDLLTREHDVVVRFNGGANAGHTVVVGSQVYKLSLIPSGIVHPGLVNVIGNGVAVHPKTLLAEIASIKEKGIDPAGRLFLSDRAHVIMPYHLEEERLTEEAAAGRAIGTTRRGIGPCYADKAGRLNSIRVGDLLDSKVLHDRLAPIVPIKNRLLRALSPQAQQFDAETVAREYSGYAEQLGPIVTDTFWHLQHALAAGRRILFEAAQGSLLDVDHGSYPYVTSSNSSACGLSSGCGVSVRQIDHFVGIVKAYTTRVGGGPFPTELLDATGDHIRTVGREFGTVTGRPRRCGWFDAVAARYTALLNGVDRIAVMLLDVLSDLDQINICHAYDIAGQRTDEFPVNMVDLARCQPVYKTFPGWKRDIRGCRKPADLPPQARAYLDAVAEYLNTPVQLCSVGPDREQTVYFQ